MNTIGQVIGKHRITLFWCLRGLKKAQREAVYTLFSFCRHIDTIIKSQMSTASKLDLLNAWKLELDNIYEKKVPATKIGRKIYKNCMRFKIQKEDFSRILEAALLDFPKPIQAPSNEVFEAYCEGFAIVPIYITLLILGIMNEPKMRLLAKNFGKALILTDILRNIKEDALRGHLYIQKEVLQKAEINTTDPMAAITDANIIHAREILAKQAAICFQKTYKLLFMKNGKVLRPLRFVFHTYKKYFDMMQSRGWEIMSPKPEIKKIDKIAIALNTIFDKY
ncbi:MAG: squalene/phytoene synthase family protein [Alphaproteobacteria bacterium]|nr:squalene/phytoene synthase family protein [Alphaproteobacteria bacterium]